MANVLNVIEPYWHQDTWVFDDESKGLDKEPLEGQLEELGMIFVQDIPAMIDYVVKDIPNARKGFMLLFSSQPFAGYQVELTRVVKEDGGYWYKAKNYWADGWLSPAVLRYFETAPASIYVKAEPSRARYDLIIEVVTLKDRIEKLEHLVGKLTLENEALRKSKES